MARTIVCITEPFHKPKSLTDLVIFADIRSFIPQWDAADYLNACRTYAQEHQVYLVPSRFVVNNILYLCLFSPQGEILGIQGATHLNLSYRDKLQQYDKVEVLQTPIGNLFLCVDVDIYYPEVLRLAKLKGAEIVISSQYIDAYDLNHHMITTGMWNAAQQNGVFVVGCCNAFSALSAPWDITSDQSGYLVPPAHTRSLFCKVFLNKLERSSLAGPLAPRLNKTLVERYASVISQR